MNYSIENFNASHRTIISTIYLHSQRKESLNTRNRICLQYNTMLSNHGWTYFQKNLFNTFNHQYFTNQSQYVNTNTGQQYQPIYFQISKNFSHPYLKEKLLAVALKKGSWRSIDATWCKIGKFYSNTDRSKYPKGRFSSERHWDRHQAVTVICQSDSTVIQWENSIILVYFLLTIQILILVLVCCCRPLKLGPLLKVVD